MLFDTCVDGGLSFVCVQNQRPRTGPLGPNMDQQGANKSKFEARSFLFEGTFALFGGAKTKTSDTQACREKEW